MKPAFTAMTGLVPAIRSGRVPRPMAGTSPAMTMKVTSKASRFLVSSPPAVADPLGMKPSRHYRMCQRHWQ
jgi:hypothetical protein